MPDESKTAVVGAVAAGVAIAVIKFAVAALGGSSAMFSEGIHSTIDTANDSLLLLGLKRSKRPPDAQHPFGYGKELYFWSLIVSVTVLGVGGGVTFYEGILHILKPERIHRTPLAFLALGCAFLFEGVSFVIAVRQFRTQNQNKRFWEAIKEAKDPSTFMVIGEDAAALAGIVIAATGIYLNSRGILTADGISSLLIGLLLGALAVFLIYETRDLLIGEAVEKEITQAIQELAERDESISSVDTPQTIHFGPENVLVTMDVSFDRNRSAGEVADAVDRIQQAIREKFPAVKHVYIDPESRR
jgi:cation diffusion facilitator family transporter